MKKARRRSHTKWDCKTCHRQYPGGTGRCSRRSLPDRWQPSPFQRRVGLRSARIRGLLGVYSRCGLYGC